MNKKERKAKLRAWAEQQRAAERTALPIPAETLKAMFDMLDTALSRKACDHSRRLTEDWLTANNHDVEAVGKWLDDTGGHCDCEVLANSEETLDQIMRDA